MSLGSVKRKRKLTTSYSLLFKNFAGCYVTIAVKNIRAVGARPGRVANVMLAGFLIDEDNEYLFLGKEDNEIYMAVKKDEVASIMLTDEVEDLLSSIEMPPGSEVQ